MAQGLWAGEVLTVWNMSLQLRQLEHLGSIISQLPRQIKCLLIGGFLPRAESWGRAEGDKIVQLGFGGSASVALTRIKVTRAKGPDPRASSNMLVFPLLEQGNTGQGGRNHAR